MLVLKRKEGQWVEITDKLGNLLRIRLCNVEIRMNLEGRMVGQANLAFGDPDRNFEIDRPERKPKTTPTEPT
jgi:hypothetical protein